jgi:hypothetical protein
LPTDPPLKRGFTSGPQGAVAQIPFRSLKRIFDHSKICFTANPKLAFQAQTLDLRSFRFIMAAPGSGYSELGSRGELYVVEIDNTMLGRDSNGNEYDMVQVKVTGQGAPPDPSGVLGYENAVAIWAILSEPRYGARACTGPKGTVSSRTP